MLILCKGEDVFVVKSNLEDLQLFYFYSFQTYNQNIIVYRLPFSIEVQRARLALIDYNTPLMCDMAQQVYNEEIDTIDELSDAKREIKIKSAVSNCSTINFDINYLNYEHTGALGKNEYMKVIRKLHYQQNTLISMFTKMKVIIKSVQTVHSDMKNIFQLQQAQHKGLLQKQRECFQEEISKPQQSITVQNINQ